MSTIADAGVGGVGGHPVGLDELFGMRVGHGEDGQHGKHEQSLAHAAAVSPYSGRRERYDFERRLGAGGGRGPGRARRRPAISSPCGATVTVIDVRDRVGGRVWTIRDGFAEGQHAEAGGDMIDEEQHEIRDLAAELGLKLTRILKGGFGYVRADQAGRAKIVARNAQTRLGAAGRASCAGSAGPTRLAERRWDSPITADLARRSVAAWLDQVKADADLRATATGLRGFFLADPDELSLIALVDQFAESDAPAPGAMYRIEGGNDRLAVGARRSRSASACT